MYIKFFVLAVLFLCNQLLFSGIYDITKDEHEQYQDIYINGQVMRKASNNERYRDECFTIINSILSQYKRSFTMLDIGASQGYFTFRAAEKYPHSVFVMLKGSNKYYPKISEQLHSIFNENTNADNIIWLDRSIRSSDFVRLSQCEHFDVIVAQNILHWFPKDWKTLFDSFLKMSHVTIIELPPVDNGLDENQFKLRTDIHNYLRNRANQKLHGVSRHTNPNKKTSYYIFINESGRSYLDKTSMVHPSFGDREHLVTFDFSEKHLIKSNLASDLKYVKSSTWHPGISLITYLCLNGQYPHRKDLSNNLLEDNEHFDWMPNNMILQGSKMQLIDKGDPKNEAGGIGQNRCTPVRVKRCKQLILEGDEAKVLGFLRDQSQ